MIIDIPRGIEQDAKGNHKLPKERFKDSNEVREYCEAMVSADRKGRLPLRDAVDGLWSGNPVYSQRALRSKGQGWRARVNYREMEGLIQAQQTPFYDLVTAVDQCIEVDVDFGTGDERDQIQNSIARNFTWLMMNRWRKGFNFHVPFQQLTMLKHGLGGHLWPTSSWIPRTPRAGHILFPDGTPANFDEDGKAFMVRDFVPGEDVYGYIRNEKAAGELGWNVEAVWKALLQTRKKNDSIRLSDYQSMIRNGDMGASASTQSGLWLNWLYIKEYSGKISLYVTAEGVEGDYLFKKRNKHTEWPLTLFPYDIGDGDLHSIRGLGARTKDFFELSNRLKNSTADQIFLSGLLMFKGGQGVDPEKLKLLKLNQLGIVPQGLEQLTPFSLPDMSRNMLPFSQMLQQTLSSNNQTYMGGAPEPRDRETAHSYNIRATDSAQVSNGAHSLYGSNLRDFYQRILLNVLKPTSGESPADKMAKEFRDRCEKDGVPKEAFGKVVEVREIMSTGSGSAAARLNALMQIFQYIYPVTSEDRKISIERDLVSALVPGNKTDRYARNMTDNDMPPSSDMSFATQENNQLAQGGEALAAATQDQVGHLQIHLGKAAEIAQAVQQGAMDPAQALAILEAFGAHCAQHLQLLQGNPMKKNEFKALAKEWEALSKLADQLKQQVDEASDEQPQGEPQGEDAIALEYLKRIGYKDSPESVKIQMEQRAGVPRQPGEISVPASSSAIKVATTQLKARGQAAKERQQLNGSK